jgi:hypothetical protein
MVFAEALTSASLGVAAGADNADGSATFTLVYGGAGDSFASFDAAAASEVGRDDILTLTAKFAISENGGGIMRIVTNGDLERSDLPQSAWQRTLTNFNAILVRSALEESVDADNAEAKAAHDFMAFGGTLENPVLTESLGSVMLGIKSGLRNAQGEGDDAIDDNTGALTVEGNKDVVSTLSDIIAPPATSEAANPVTFSGDVSFVSAVALVANGGCAGLSTATDLRVPSEEDPEEFTDDLMARDANRFTTAQYLCLMADGETVIPEGSYSVQTMYKKKGSGYAFAAPGSTHPLGTISHDGTTVHIPFLTTYEGYNQRLVLRNRANREITYTVTFKPEADVVVTPDTYSGTMDANTVTMTRVQDIVEIVGASSRTTATLISNAAKGTLGVATTLVNMEDRSTDTETHLPLP